MNDRTRSAALGLAWLAALAMCGCNRKEESSASAAIDVWWFQWPPADGLAELGKEFQKETGIEVKVRQIPIESYQTIVLNEFGNKHTGFDIVIGDSQWIGRYATSGLYVELTDWLKNVTDLKKIHGKAARYLCEYPEGSGKWFAAPAETDAIGLAYRKDWIEDPAEKAAFQKKYGRPLAPPDSWDEAKQVAEFFHRPDQKRYGFAMPTGRAYDEITMGVQNFLWSFGGMWHEPGSHKVKGFLDTPGTAAAIDFMKEMLKLGPKGAERLGYGDVLDSFMNGSTAMILDYFAFFPGIDAQFGPKVGFAVVPQKDGRRVASLGGQGFSISAKIEPAEQEMAKKFIAWFLQRKIQEEWIKKPAGFTANVDILKSDAFRKATAYNAPFADSIDTMQDFWNVPCFNQLLSETQKYVGKAVDGEMGTMDALRELAEKQEEILKSN